MLQMTTLTRVKDFLVIDDRSTTSDALLVQLIKNVSAEVEAYLNRVVKVAAQTEYFDITRGQVSIQLRAYPVTVMTGIYNDTDRAFAVATLVATDDYYVDTQKGIVNFDIYITPGAGALKVMYTGGMAVDTTTFIAAYPAIESAVMMEVASRYQRRSTLGLIAITTSGGSVTVAQKGNFLPVVEQILDSEARY